MGIKYHTDFIQGSDEWHAARCGLLTASEMHLIITPTLKIASNDKERSHLFELLAQRITKYVEPRYISDDMLRGQDDEIEARALYAKHYRPVRDVGFVTNDSFGFTLGYSPDGLVGDDGAIECKSRRQKFQIQTIVENVLPPEFNLQIQTGMLVANLKWIDFVSYCGGLPLYILRVYPDDVVRGVILQAAGEFEQRLAERLAQYRDRAPAYYDTERLIKEMHL